MDGTARRNLAYAAYMVSSIAMLFASAYTITFHEFSDGMVLFIAAIVLMIVFAVYHVKQMRLLGRKGSALSILFGADGAGYVLDGEVPAERRIHVGRLAIHLGFRVTTFISVLFFISERYLYGVMVLLPFPALILSLAFVRTMWLRRTR